MSNASIAVFGANGRSGRVFVDAALRAGYSVRAGVHHGNLTPVENLVVIPCDATNPQEVAEVLLGTQYVVSLLGHVPKSPHLVQTTAIQTVIGEMHKQGIKRLISLTGTGVRVAGDTPSLVDLVANAIIKHIDPHRINDGIQHAAVVQNSNLDWTIIRVLKLANSKKSHYRLTPGGPAKLQTSREEVADAILAILSDNSTYGTHPVIS